MGIRRIGIVLASLALGLVLVAGNATGDPGVEFPDAIACDDLSPALRRAVEALYESSLIADYAFSKDKDKKLINLCSNHVSFAWEGSKEIETYVEPLTEEVLGLPSFERLHNYNIFVKNDGTAHLTCRPDEYNPSLSVTWNYVTINEVYDNDDDERTFRALRRAIVFKVGVIVTDAFKLFSDQELVRVKHISKPRDDQEYFLFEGTNPKDPRSWRTSLGQIFESKGSCAFDIAAFVTGIISTEYMSEGTTLVVAGHSLGGAVTQYVATDREQHPMNYNSKIQYVSHSFNAVGIKDPTFNPKELYSFFIDREILSKWREDLGMTQAGQLIRYIPIAGSDLDKAESIKKHYLESVKSGLCACLSGTGCVNLQ